MMEVEADLGNLSGRASTELTEPTAADHDPSQLSGPQLQLKFVPLQGLATLDPRQMRRSFKQKTPSKVGHESVH